ncbi:histidine kinase [Niallia taxi]|uniref:sensor histidine kinase n=1 Tax=Niallia taxi TaxID=2499688 RepID=UPI002E1BC6B7|nr:histidine kinase [Niallia taxi]MED4053438.1 histidine kinase [Niallia taxi]MED4119278.1 histidine kinase [Niallia taxi]
MLKVLKKWNTLRNQILIVFLSAMFIVLLIVSILTFNQVSYLLKNNAEKQIKQVAVEANGRLESLYEQINMASKLVVTNDKVQKLLTKEYENKEVPFLELQELMGTVNTITANSDGIFSFQLFTNEEHRILPLDDANAPLKLRKSWVELAKREKGRLVWIGEDPNDANYFLAIRRVNLMDKNYANGGYILISMYKEYFQFVNKDLTNKTNQYSILLDKALEPIITDYDKPLQSIIHNDSTTVEINKKDYMVTREESDITGWTVLILTPVTALTSGISVLRSSIFVSGLIGLLIYFICSLFLSTIITRPIIRLTNTMRHASQGSLEMNPKLPSVNEINELNSTYNQLVKETNHLIKMVYEKEIVKSRSELKAIQAQINPHFLFNTLNALHWSLEEKGEEELADTVVAMSNLFRYTITNSQEDEWVFLKDELNHINDYMEIMQMRFGDKLKWRIEMDTAYELVKVPKFLIQPLVENAVIHGAGNKIGVCYIIISVRHVSNTQNLLVTVEDDGAGIAEVSLEKIKKAMAKGGITSVKGKGMAISNVFKRLKLYYQEDGHEGLEIKSMRDKGTTVSFEIPIMGGEKECIQKQS